MFNDLLNTTKQRLNVSEYKNKNKHYTQLIIGEMHFLPRVQCEELKLLHFLKQKFDLHLIGQEGSKRIVTSSLRIDGEKAIKDTNYMKKLLKKKINAVTIFNYTYPKVIVETVDDFYLKELASYIDKRCYELFRLKQQKGGWHYMNKNQKAQYNYWFGLLKTILLGDRSNFMVKNLYDLQRKLNIHFSVLICGAAHTPYRKEYKPYSVLRTLKTLPINYIITTLPSVSKFLYQKDPWNFYTKNDPTEINPYDASKQ